MSTTRLSTDTTSAELVTERWRLDPARSSVDFRAPHFWGLVTVKGHFKLYEGTLDLRFAPAVQLTIEADSLDTGIAKRDQHLRSADFFDAAHYPQVRFASDSAVLDGDSLKVRGRLHAAGKSIPLELDAAVDVVDGDFQIEAVAHATHRELGMTWSPLGIARPISKLIVKGRLQREPNMAAEHRPSARSA
jgi:polyisoprenoid-binding protein YceI